jgi:phage replication-related protein YjqB (UPF0714/DUF867 family)
VRLIAALICSSKTFLANRDDMVDNTGLFAILEQNFWTDEMVPYINFKELASREIEGQDYQIRLRLRDPRVLIMAPHGGKIEPTTEVIAEAIAGEDYSFYSFEGLKGDSRGLHIESHLFDEPQALKALEEAEIVVSVHGQIDQKEAFVMVGGLQESLRLEVIRQLEATGFQTRIPTEGLMGIDPMNICNRGKSKQGVQLEVSRRVRDLLRTNKDQLETFARGVGKAIRICLNRKS